MAVHQKKSIVDCHVHSGDWNYPFLRNRSDLNVSDYWDSAPAEVGAAIFFPSDQKDNDLLLKNIQADNDEQTYTRSYMAFWYDPYDLSSHNILQQLDNELTMVEKAVESAFGTMQCNIEQCDYGIHSSVCPDDLQPSIYDLVVAIKVHAGIDRVMGGISNGVYSDAIRIAKRAGIPIIVHCGGWKDTSHHDYVVRAAYEHHDATFIAAHCGGKSDKDQIAAIDRFCDIDNVLVDISSVKYKYVLEHALKRLGPERIIFGSDWPIMSPFASIGALRDCCTEELFNEVRKSSWKLINKLCTI